ncbi:ribose-5-phosphate isomerase A [Salinarchaeum sp. Harcht-Bsk1]|uniref:ribose-5-phosphate isomerase RpiA n=1 Tax=Salinarchaeum sp. Harcht-Bsk1 TaxID=1333523 RepID=UPI0003423587|nr:ribose-5-phosphate isomerase RpiA [Salinarchaeum sp. Harcht-Bsk1]AGN01670.1 ribose-5-phosphate isomerase A [Salinarchaeum sp. Harcht-Bsk1]
MDAATLKRRAGERAVEAVDDGDVVGLGSGSTAAAAIRALGERVDSGLDIQGVPTSHQSREIALNVGIPVVDLDQVEAVEVAIDGADQVATDADSASAIGAPPLIKGGGGCHAREKIVDAAAEELLIVVDPSKLVPTLDAAVPVEVLPAARTTVAEELRDIGGEPTLRDATEKSGPVVTDNGNLVLDTDFGEIDDPPSLATACSGIPGVLDHGIFVDLADRVLVGREDGVEALEY